MALLAPPVNVNVVIEAVAGVKALVGRCHYPASLLNITELALARALLEALSCVRVHKQRVSVVRHVCPRVQLHFADHPWKVFGDVNLIGCRRSVEVVIIEHLRAENHSLVDEDVELGLPLKVSRIAHSHEVPVVPGLVEEIVNVLDRVIEVHPQEGIRESEAKLVV